MLCLRKCHSSGYATAPHLSLLRVESPRAGRDRIAGCKPQNPLPSKRKEAPKGRHLAAIGWTPLVIRLSFFRSVDLSLRDRELPPRPIGATCSPTTTRRATMAKAKSTNSPKRQAASSKRKASASNNGQSAPTKKATSKTRRAFSQEEIGQVAGELWGVLSTDGGQTLAAIKKSIDAPPELIFAALGWLAREDKLEFTFNGRTPKISLR